MGKYALVYHQGRKIYLGLYGSPESKAAYNRLLAELQANPVAVPTQGGGKKVVTVSELAAEFLDYAKNSVNSTDYTHYWAVDFDFQSKKEIIRHKNEATGEFEESWTGDSIP